jgi:hypothetical protein
MVDLPLQRQIFSVYQFTTRFGPHMPPSGDSWINIQMVTHYTINYGKIKVVPVLINHYAWWGCTDPRILNLGASLKWVVSSTPRQLYPRVKSPRYPLDRRLRGPQNRSGRRKEEKNHRSLCCFSVYFLCGLLLAVILSATVRSRLAM